MDLWYQSSISRSFQKKKEGKKKIPFLFNIEKGKEKKEGMMEKQRGKARWKMRPHRPMHVVERKWSPGIGKDNL